MLRRAPRASWEGGRRLEYPRSHLLAYPISEYHDPNYPIGSYGGRHWLVRAWIRVWEDAVIDPTRRTLQTYYVYRLQSKSSNPRWLQFVHYHQSPREMAKVKECVKFDAYHNSAVPSNLSDFDEDVIVNLEKGYYNGIKMSCAMDFCSKLFRFFL